MSKPAIQALKLIDGTRCMNLTHRANVLVSRQAATLLRNGLIRYGRGTVAYELTAAGSEMLAEHCDTPGCFNVRPCPRHGA